MAITSTANSILQQLVIASSDRAVVQGASSLQLSDQGTADAQDSTRGLMILGQPRMLPSCTIPQGYYADILVRATLGGASRLAVRSDGQLILSDDFKSRSRLTLIGRNESPGSN